MAAYSALADLLIDDLPVSATFDKQKYINDAADEMDIQLGERYKLPLDVLALPVRSQLVLKRINNYLASGRILLRLALSQEDKKLHELAVSWIQEAQNALLAIKSGSVDLIGADLVDDTQRSSNTGPSIFNEDSTSLVKDFYVYTERTYLPYITEQQAGILGG